MPSRPSRLIAVSFLGAVGRGPTFHGCLRATDYPAAARGVGIAIYGQ
jgi:hypothetical protein